MIEDIKNLSKKIFKDCSWELFIERKKKIYASSKNFSIDRLNKSEDIGIGIRVKKGKKLGFSYCSSIDKDIFQQSAKKALDILSISSEDSISFPEKIETENLEYFDEFSLKMLTEEEKINKAIEIEEIAYKKDDRIKRVREASFSEVVVEKWILNSEGLEIHSKGTFYSAMVAAIAEDKGDSQIAWNYTASRYLEDLDIESMVSEAVFDATSLLGASPIKTISLDVLFPPKVFSELLSSFFNMFSGESFIKGKTAFIELKNKDIFPKEVVIVDDGKLYKGIGTESYDDEGIPKKRTVIIEDGKFKNFLHNIFTGKKSGEISTGNGKRKDYRFIPSVSFSNLFLENGNENPDEILKSSEEIFYVVELIGLHTVDTTTGDFSLGATGLLYSKGEILQSVKEVTLAGNFVELLKNIYAIGNDLRFYGNVGSPSVFVKNLMIGGI